MGNVSYQVEHIESGIVTLLETFDLTDTSGPGILTRYGKVVDLATIQREGIVSASRRIKMPEQQAITLGLIVRD